GPHDLVVAGAGGPRRRHGRLDAVRRELPAPRRRRRPRGRGGDLVYRRDGRARLSDARPERGPALLRRRRQRPVVGVDGRPARGVLRFRLGHPHAAAGRGDDGRPDPDRPGSRLHRHRPLRPLPPRLPGGDTPAPPRRPPHRRRRLFRAEVL
ncbi:MAG: hypothetical protein AVDCRST_MAG05-2227, partial [uncultured Rubrobacteraceae bacterium]